MKVISSQERMLHVSQWNYNDEVLQLVMQHANQCKVWSQYKIELPVLAIYVTFLTKKLQIFDHDCSTVVLLHRYVQQTKGMLPESMNSLLNFKRTGTIAVENVHNMKQESALQSTTCGICKENIYAGEAVYIFPECNHIFHSNSKCKAHGGGKKNICKKKEKKKEKNGESGISCVMWKHATSILVFVCLMCLFAILILILINAIQRTFFYQNNTANNTNVLKKKCVDFYEVEFKQLELLTTSKIALFGMTALIDRGVQHEETGIYMLQADNIWTKMAVPEIGDCFRILRGEYANKQYTVRPSFIHEIRPPTEIQYITNTNLFQELQETTQIIYINNDVTTVGPHVTANNIGNNPSKHALAFAQGRLLTIINASKTQKFVLIAGSENVVVPPATIRLIHLIPDSHNVYGSYFVSATSEQKLT